MGRTEVTVGYAEVVRSLATRAHRALSRAKVDRAEAGSILVELDALDATLRDHGRADLRRWSSGLRERLAADPAASRN